MITINNLRRIRTTNASTATTAAGVNIGISYSTIIAAEKNGVSFYTENYYSNTTAHHKSDILRIFNNAQNVEVTQTALTAIAAGDIKPDQVLEELKIKKQLQKFIKLNLDYNAAAWNNSIDIYFISNLINNLPAVEESKKEYKNGSTRTIKTKKTTFKYVSNFYFKITTHKKLITVKAAARAGAPIVKNKNTRENNLLNTS